MNRDILIAFTGNQCNGGDTEKIELFTEGKYYKKGKMHYVSYDESEITGLNGTTTTLKIDCDNKRITMLRFGSNNTQLIFEQGHKHICCYETDYGALTVGVNSDYVDIDMDGGELSAKYTIDVDSAVLGVNDFHIKITERN